MSKIVFENKKGKITILNKLTYPESVNERVYNAITSGVFEGFLPVNIRRKRKETIVECHISSLVPLNEYFGGIVTKKMFLNLVLDIIAIIKKCEKHMVNANNLDLQCDRIFFDPYTKKIKCIFWPVVNNQRSNPPHIFFKQLPYDLNFNTFEDNTYLDTYKSFFNGNNPFSVNAFEKMVLKLMGKDAPATHIVSSGALSGRLSEEKSKQVEVKNDIEYDPFSVQKTQKNDKDIEKPEIVFCQSCGNENPVRANYCKKCGAPLDKKCDTTDSDLNDEDDYDFGTMVLGGTSGGTTVLGYESVGKTIYPILVRVKTDETFVIDKPNFRIGTMHKYCDLLISDNSYISRNHADIITRDERFYIVDRNSTNKTFVDGKVIPNEQEVEIFPGTGIRLANEEFEFNVK